MPPRPALLALAACLLLAGSAREESQLVAAVQAHVRAQLLDEQSARFRALSVHRTERRSLLVCGQINGTDAAGAYVGFREFTVYQRAEHAGPLPFDPQRPAALEMYPQASCAASLRALRQEERNDAVLEQMVRIFAQRA